MLSTENLPPQENNQKQKIRLGHYPVQSFFFVRGTNPLLQDNPMFQRRAKMASLY
jgi:hypothetical protein